MTISITKLKLFLSLSLLAFSSCEKDWLDAKPSQDILVPTRLVELQSILDNTNYFNQRLVGLHEVATPDYYLEASIYTPRPDVDRNTYSWSNATNFYGQQTVLDWDNSYKSIFAANTVLENLGKVPFETRHADEWNNVKGGALFYRAWLYYNLAQIFCKPYIPQSADSDLGIILRLEPDVNLPSQRASVARTYDQIVNDLKTAADLLPIHPLNGWKTRPTKLAAFALLARVHLSMQNYHTAKLYSDSCLNLYNILMDYNGDPSIDPTALQYTFIRYNVEVLFHSSLNPVQIMGILVGRGHVDSVLYSMYSDNDLRKELYFKMANGKIGFRGGYDGPPSLFNGLATDEVYLIRAECLARAGEIESALKDINTLYIKRWNNAVAFEPITAGTQQEAIEKILAERRKELCFRGVAWTDLRRLNQDPVYARTITRGLLGSSELFTLSPNDDRYVFPIPDNEILYSGVTQNER